MAKKNVRRCRRLSELFHNIFLRLIIIIIIIIIIIPKNINTRTWTFVNFKLPYRAWKISGVSHVFEQGLAWRTSH